MKSPNNLCNLLTHFPPQHQPYSITVPSDYNRNGSLEHYASFVPGLVDFLDDCHKNGISPHVDCNNPPKCTFPNEQLVILFTQVLILSTKECVRRLWI